MDKTLTPLDCLRKNIKHLRLAHQMTQERVAAITELSYKYYQSLEAGRITNPTYETVDRLSQLFEIEYWKLFHPTMIPESKIKKMKPKSLKR